MSSGYYNRNRLCGCWFPFANNNPYSHADRRYLPQVELKSSTTILATTSRTTLKQTFVNDQDKKLDEVQYTFPLYDGVSVVGFTCTVGSKTIVGIVKEKQQARVEYQAAVARGETAGLLEQMPEASDVFTTSVGNVPAKEKVHIEIIYLGELKHDAETDGSRFTIPTIIAPRYGSVSPESANALSNSADEKGGISISVNVTLDDGTIVRGLQSPSHPIAVTMGRTADMDEDFFSNNQASAALTLGTTELDQDFVIVVLAKGTDIPRALLETHPTIPNQRAIMTTLVPKFNIPNISPEVVFVIDRSGSMQGKIELVVSAMKIFLKSLPIGVKFNICSFGSSHSFLFKKSKTYDQSSLKEAMSHLNTFSANFGGTEMLQPVKAAVENRYADLPLEVMLLTDGEIWNQEELFTFINQTSNARFFTLGIGSGASSALVEGIARAGNGFAQFVGENEKMDKRVVRMLKGALTPHISDYSLEVTYGQVETSSADDDFEMIDSAGAEKATSTVTELKKGEPKKPISLFDTTATEEPTNPPAGRYDNLPDVTIPKILQAPHRVPALYPFNRTTVYLILGPDAPRKTPKSVILRGTSDHGPLELEIPIQDVGTGETVHQLAAKKAVHELEQGRGWITEARNDQGKLFEKAHEGKWDLIVEREAVRLGVLFQVGGKWCSFVAVEKDNGQQHDATSTLSSGAETTRRIVSHAQISPPASKSQGMMLFSSSTSSLFGAVAHRPVPSQAPQSGGLFGLPSSTSAAKSVAGGVLFASGPVKATTSSCFGTGGSGFGASSLPSAVGGSFGNSSIPFNSSSTARNNGGGPFGSTSSSTSNFASGGGLFGATTSTTPSLATADEPSPSPQPAQAASPLSPSSPLDSRAETPADFSLAEGAGGRGGPRMSTGGASPRMQKAPQAASYASFGAPAPGAPFMRSSGMAPAIQMQMQQSAAQSGPPASATELADYQTGLMMLHQDNKARKRMVPQAQPPPPTALPVAPPQARSYAMSQDKGNAEIAAMPRVRMQKKSGGMSLFSRGSRGDDKEKAHVDAEEKKVDVRSLSDTEKMYKIIDLQEFDGSWQVSSKLLELLGVSQDQFAGFDLGIKSVGGNKTHAATALAIAWLKGKVPKEEDVWDMVTEKALGWLATEIGASAEEAVKMAGNVF